MLLVEELKERVAQGQGVYLNEVDENTLDNADMLLVVLPIPVNTRARMMLLGNTLFQLCLSYKGKARSTLVALAGALSYLINSASGNSGEFYDFDASAVKGKIRHLIPREEDE